MTGTGAAIVAATESSGWTPTATATLIAALIAGLIAAAGIWINGLRADRARRRELYARGLAATLAYREFAYAIRRRRADVPGEERVRLSEALREVQQELAYCESWLRTEQSGRVAAEYRSLLDKTREVAGGYMREAWNSPPARGRYRHEHPEHRLLGARAVRTRVPQSSRRRPLVVERDPVVAALMSV